MLIGACDRNPSRAADAMPPLSTPSAIEAGLLDFALSDPAMDPNCIDPVTPHVERPDIGPDTLSFGDGRIAQYGDPRYDEANRSWNLAAAARLHRLRLPLRPAGAAKTRPCESRLSLYPPYFHGDVAFVVADERQAGRPGGQLRFWMFRKRGTGWPPVAYGHSIYGRPVI